ncbi:acetophenone carboxylase gamma subunit (plasmid) [Antarctobacter heliothermus]|uniref:Acetophenone carboxylase gamma subunit n=1 Tax=Antarctobacter heliothermus TaxID=74033 RepID=A0A222EBG6_9RHOB|nr:hydantoinase/oxoprolinase family protein [Antarctobacter heliothermus]ASP23492.1 acetophenone carboxylase gamma subunit [Antarctobacter heliothermus]
MTADPRIRIGVDVGGTFTDFVLVDGKRGVIFTGKQLTTHSDPSQAICEGVERIVREAGLEITDIDAVVHGTTLVTNTLIERNGATVGLITTKGFRDILEVGHEMRYDLYDLFMEKPEPIVPRPLRLTVAERMSAKGEVLDTLDEDGVRAQAAELVAAGVEAIAISFLNAFANPAHEQRAAQIIADAYPDLPVTTSVGVAPEIREYERTCTAVSNAYVLPKMRRYIRVLRDKLSDLGFRGTLSVMLSSGGTAALSLAEDAPIQMIESGPAAGAISGAHYAKLTGSDRVVAFDMGGTTAKMCLIENGQPEHSQTFEAGRVRRFRQGSGIPLKVPVIDLIEIGAGGGSISRLDRMGLLKVGPESASSDPGPVCYRKGGADPTVTDSDLMLGYLSPDYFLGGEMTLDLQAVSEAMVAKVGESSGLDDKASAAGIHAVVNNNMAAATRRYIAEKGRDPRKYTLIATGGAGPVHAYGLAKELKISRLIVPFGAGVSSALGFLLAAPAVNDVRSQILPLEQASPDLVQAHYDTMMADAAARLANAGADPDSIVMKPSVDARYRGQGFDIEVPLPADFLTSDFRADLQARFEEKYKILFGRHIKDVAIEIVSWRLAASAPRVEIKLDFQGEQILRKTALKGTRMVHFAESGFVEAKVYNRYGLTCGMTFSGPAVIEERESTAVLGPDTTITVDPWLNLIVDIETPQGEAA